MTHQQIQACAISTRDLLQEIATANYHIMRDLLISELSPEHWQDYRHLTETLTTAAAEASAFANSLRTNVDKPKKAAKDHTKEQPA